MHIQNLVRFYKIFLKILSGSKITRDRRTDGWNDRQPKSNIAPNFSKRGYKYNFCIVTNECLAIFISPLPSVSASLDMFINNLYVQLLSKLFIYRF